MGHVFTTEDSVGVLSGEVSWENGAFPGCYVRKALSDWHAFESDACIWNGKAPGSGTDETWRNEFWPYDNSYERFPLCATGKKIS